MKFPQHFPGLRGPIIRVMLLHSAVAFRCVCSRILRVDGLPRSRWINPPSPSIRILPASFLPIATLNCNCAAPCACVICFSHHLMQHLQPGPESVPPALVLDPPFQPLGFTGIFLLCAWGIFSLCADTKFPALALFARMRYRYDGHCERIWITRI